MSLPAWAQWKPDSGSMKKKLSLSCPSQIIASLYQGLLNTLWNPSYTWLIARHVKRKFTKTQPDLWVNYSSLSYTLVAMTSFWTWMGVSVFSNKLLKIENSLKKVLGIFRRGKLSKSVFTRASYLCVRICANKFFIHPSRRKSSAKIKFYLIDVWANSVYVVAMIKHEREQ